jgi:NAD(P)-dependent dehydrogenase (short-subunit alcohol dehydrogenase family)
VRVFLAQARGGTIVSVGSITGYAGSPMQAAYGAAKAGLASLARSVAAEYSQEGIRMNVVSCGPIATPVARAAQAGTAEWIPMGRPANRARSRMRPSSSPLPCPRTSPARVSCSTAVQPRSARSPIRHGDGRVSGVRVGAPPHQRSPKRVKPVYKASATTTTSRPNKRAFSCTCFSSSGLGSP